MPRAYDPDADDTYADHWCFDSVTSESPGHAETGDEKWAALREHIREERSSSDEQANDHSDMSGDRHASLAERCWGRVEAFDALLRVMDEIERR